jgi:hypothetical protein
MKKFMKKLVKNSLVFRVLTAFLLLNRPLPAAPTPQQAAQCANEVYTRFASAHLNWQNRFFAAMQEKVPKPLENALQSYAATFQEKPLMRQQQVGYLAKTQPDKLVLRQGVMMLGLIQNGDDSRLRSENATYAAQAARNRVAEEKWARHPDQLAFQKWQEQWLLEDGLKRPFFQELGQIQQQYNAQLQPCLPLFTPALPARPARPTAKID